MCLAVLSFTASLAKVKYFSYSVLKSDACLAFRNAAGSDNVKEQDG
jgi:hypothetical protein